jgi:hypothetical protein
LTTKTEKKKENNPEFLHAWQVSTFAIFACPFWILPGPSVRLSEFVEDCFKFCFDYLNPQGRKTVTCVLIT